MPLTGVAHCSILFDAGVVVDIFAVHDAHDGGTYVKVGGGGLDVVRDMQDPKSFGPQGSNVLTVCMVQGVAQLVEPELDTPGQA